MHPARQRTLRQSVLDRLTQGDEPDPRTWEESVDLLKANLLRDLERLLNTRQTGEPAGKPLTWLPGSIYNYGLPDFASMSAESARTPARLLKRIQDQIEQFEPRLTDVRISLAGSAKDSSRKLRFSIEAKLRIEPHPEQIEFDTVLEMDSGQIRIGD